MFVFGTCCPRGRVGCPRTAERDLPGGLGMQERAALHARLFLTVQRALGCRDRWAGVWGPRPSWGAGVLLSRPPGHHWFCPT